ncbi:MAG: hypothetical protein IH846_03110, partial [Acidobacteria bacterium]|nr:hypothetical protein [Acidobacteriota bacterium]
WKRLSRRYLGGENSQFWLAATYKEELREKGIDGFPKAVREWYRSWNKPGTVVRLRGAVAFAQHGICGIWIALLPISKKELVKPLEANLIPIANQWNIAHGYEPLINKQHQVWRMRRP